jgi:negative regulator of flagellin synthesis FlgM
MTEKIGGFHRPSTETKPAGAQSSDKSKGTNTAAPSQGSVRGDEVSLTASATRLKSIEARIGELPDVDRERVAQLRELIDSGEYKIDFELVAQRLIQLEQALS